MNSLRDTDGLPAGLFIEQMRQAIGELPVKNRRTLMLLCERLGHWFHLQNEANLHAQTTAEELRLENLCLRFDLEVTRRERDEHRSSNPEE
ncbi:MAG: hypothetical protein U1D30_25445 [Planctomycetota bacterium]